MGSCAMFDAPRNARIPAQTPGFGCRLATDGI
jgi:hypothetical protein